MKSLTIRRRALRDLLLLGSCFVALAHCQLETEGLGLDGGQAGTSSDGFGGASGGPFTQGTGGSSNEGGTAGVGGLGGAAGVGGTDNPSGASGAADGGEGGSTAGGASGAAGEGGGGAGGSGGAGCDASKGEFSVPSAPGSCFFFLGQGSLVTSPLDRTQWDWDEARDDCEALQAQLASLAVLDEYDALRDRLRASSGGSGGGGMVFDDSVWIGGRTAENFVSNKDELAQSFKWQSGEAWGYTKAGVEPWEKSQPDFVGVNFVEEKCVEMRRAFNFELNNLSCDTNLKFVLCEKKPSPTSERETARPRAEGTTPVASESEVATPRALFEPPP